MADSKSRPQTYPAHFVNEFGKCLHSAFQVMEREYNDDCELVDLDAGNASMTAETMIQAILIEEGVAKNDDDMQAIWERLGIAAARLVNDPSVYSAT